MTSRPSAHRSVHGVVVLVPLAALGAVALAGAAGMESGLRPLVAAGALAAAATATLAKLAGDQLAAAIEVSPASESVIAQHGKIRLFTVIAVWPFATLAIGAVVLDRAGRRRRARIVGVLFGGGRARGDRRHGARGHSGSGSGVGVRDGVARWRERAVGPPDARRSICPAGAR